MKQNNKTQKIYTEKLNANKILKLKKKSRIELMATVRYNLALKEW